MAKQRTDAERRARQCERLSRLLRTLRLIMGPGRWDAAALAGELECSRRTVHRLLQTLSMAGVPWFYDDASQAYRVRPGFRFPTLDVQASPVTSEPSPADLREMAAKLLRDSETFQASLNQFLGFVRDVAK